VNILRVQDLPLIGAKLIFYNRFTDHRGYFSEVYRKSDFKELAKTLGLGDFDFQQANESSSFLGVIRGFHFQYDPPQGKLIRLLYGHGIDMALDVRPHSPTKGQVIMVDMTDRPDGHEAKWIWLPPGLAHGNFYLANSAIEYFCNAPYNPSGEVGINPLDPSLDFSLCPADLVNSYRELLKIGPILSDKDKNSMNLSDWWADERVRLL
jgi:dTDP-4-dehydrorhamnose 3,5-epimerase